MNYYKSDSRIEERCSNDIPISKIILSESYVQHHFLNGNEIFSSRKSLSVSLIFTIIIVHAVAFMMCSIKLLLAFRLFTEFIEDKKKTFYFRK